MSIRPEQETFFPDHQYLFGEDWFDTTSLSPDLTAIREPHHSEDVLSFAINLPNGVILVDSGMGAANIRAALPAEKPVTVLLTHSDWDHTGGVREFSDVRIFNHPYEVRRVKRGWSSDEIGELDQKDFKKPLDDRKQLRAFQIPGYDSVRTFEDQEILNLFGLQLQAIHTPGHTFGSACFFIPRTGDLFTGDTLYPGPEYLYLPESNAEDYLKSLLKLQILLGSQIKRILPGHNAPEASPDLLKAHIQGLKGEVEPIEIIEGEDQIGKFVEKKFADFSLRLPRS